MPSHIAASDVVFGCVADNAPKYLSQALRLVQSVRWFGGAVSDAAFVVCVVDGIDPTYRTALERYGASVRLVQRFHDANPFPDKLRLLELPELKAFGTIVLLDCDTITVQDVLPFLKPGVLQARIAGFPTVTTKTFRTLFDHFKMTMPSEAYRCAVSGDPTIFYCNTGVMSWPTGLLQEFLPVWRSYTTALCNEKALLRIVNNMCEQAAFTLACCTNPIPFSRLPLEANCPIPEGRTVRNTAVLTCDPAIIHYHHRVNDEGYVLPNANPLAAKRIAAFNERLRREHLSSRG
jgi:hypothetical protein